MPINSMIRVRAAQSKLLAEYPRSAAKQQFNQQIQSDALQTRLQHYQNSLHQKFVIFHISETASSIESEVKSGEALSENISASREAYSDVFVQFAESLGDAAVQGVEGNYFSMLSHSVRAVVTFFQSESTLRTELHNELVKQLASGGVKKLNDFLDGDASVDAYLNALRSEHFYFQSEIERLYHSGQITATDFQHSIAISSGWKEEIVAAIINLRDFNFQRYADMQKSNQKYQVAPYRDLALRLIAEFLISPQQTGKVNGVSEVANLRIKFLNGRRDARIAEAINVDAGVRTGSELQGRSFAVDKNSLALKAIVATMKRRVIDNASETILDQDESLLGLLSDRIEFLFKDNLTEHEKLLLYADYYFNQVERQAVNDEMLGKRLIPTYGFWDSKPNKDDKGEIFFETLRFLGRGLVDPKADQGVMVDINRCLLLFQEKVQSVLNYFFFHFKKKLLSSPHLRLCNEKKVEWFVLQYLNHQLKQPEISHFYRSYLHGLVRYKSLLPQPHQIVLMEDQANPGQVKVKFLGGVFHQLNVLTQPKHAGWEKVRSCVLFREVRNKHVEIPSKVAVSEI